MQSGCTPISVPKASICCSAVVLQYLYSRSVLQSGCTPISLLKAPIAVWSGAQSVYSTSVLQSGCTPISLLKAPIAVWSGAQSVYSTSVLQSGWTPMHCAIQAGHTDCLDLLLSHNTLVLADQHSDHSDSDHSDGDRSDSDRSDSDHSDAVSLCELAEVVDNDGWTLAHLAASKQCTVSIAMDCCQIKIDTITQYSSVFLLILLAIFLRSYYSGCSNGLRPYAFCRCVDLCCHQSVQLACGVGDRTACRSSVATMTWAWCSRTAGSSPSLTSPRQSASSSSKQSVSLFIARQNR